MRDFSNYAEQGLQFGRTVPYEVTELANPDGTHPLLHVEHLGPSNVSMLEESLARAGAAVEQPTGVMASVQVNQDLIIKHCARRIENVFFSDGASATDADIPGFIRALPITALGRLITFVSTAANFFQQSIATSPQVLAEK